MQQLLNLQTSAYEHPFDKAALGALKKIPLLESVTNFFLNWSTIKWELVALCGSSFHVTKDSCPELFNLVRRTADTLDIDRLPQIYTKWTYGINAYTTGHKDNTVLVLYTGAVDLMPEPELTFIIGHEMGHIKSGHVLYHIMAQNIAQLGVDMGLLGSVITPLIIGFNYWSRMSEFTSDRAGLLACQDLDAALSATMKMAGLPQKYFNTTNPHIFAEQAQEFLSKYGDTANAIIKNISILDDSHPWTVMRAAELIKWVESGEYDRILSGTQGKKCAICHQAVSPEATVCPVCGSTDFE